MCCGKGAVREHRFENTAIYTMIGKIACSVRRRLYSTTTDPASQLFLSPFFLHSSPLRREGWRTTTQIMRHSSSSRLERRVRFPFSSPSSSFPPSPTSCKAIKHICAWVKYAGKAAHTVIYRVACLFSGRATPFAMFYSYKRKRQNPHACRRIEQIFIRGGGGGGTRARPP